MIKPYNTNSVNFAVSGFSKFLLWPLKCFSLEEVPRCGFLEMVNHAWQPVTVSSHVKVPFFLWWNPIWPQLQTLIWLLLENKILSKILSLWGIMWNYSFLGQSLTSHGKYCKQKDLSKKKNKEVITGDLLFKEGLTEKKTKPKPMIFEMRKKKGKGKKNSGHDKLKNWRTEN